MGPKGPLAIVLLVLLVGSHGELIDIDALLAEEAAIGDDVRCTIKITVAEDSTNADDPMIKGFALCEGNILYDETRPLSKLEPVELAKVSLSLSLMGLCQNCVFKLKDGCRIYRTGKDDATH